MNVQLEFWHVIMLLLAFFSAVWAFGKVLFAQIDQRLKERFAAMEKTRSEAQQEWHTRFGRVEENQRQLEREILTLRADLPMSYVRREDFVRNQTVIEAKLDAVAVKIENIMLRKGHE